VGRVGRQHGDEGRVWWAQSLLRLALQISTRAVRSGEHISALAPY